MRPAVALVDVGGSRTKAEVAGVEGTPLSVAAAPTPSSVPAPGRVEADADALVATATQVLAEAVARAGAAPGGAPEVLGVVVASLRQGFVLDDGYAALGPAVPNGDTRGSSHLAQVAGLYEVTGHWPAPQLTLPKLLHLRDAEPERWAAATGLLFYADHVAWRLTGARATEGAYACAGGMADVAARTWASDVLADRGVPSSLLAPLVEAGDVVGGLLPEVAARLGLPAGTPVHAGSGDTQLAALGAGGLADGVVTVVVGSSTPVQAAVARPLLDPERHPWVSTHAARDRWAVETNAGYPGTWQAWAARELRAGDPAGSPPGARGLLALTGAPEWSERAWSRAPSVGLVGLRPEHTAADVARACAEAHAFAVRAQVEDLERVLGATARQVRVVGGGGAAGLAPLLADAVGRPVLLPAGGAAHGAVALVTGALPGAGDPAVGDPAVVQPGGADLSDVYDRWREASEASEAHVAAGVR